jgi:hypothetical protein
MIDEIPWPVGVIWDGVDLVEENIVQLYDFVNDKQVVAVVFVCTENQSQNQGQ